MWSCPLNTPLCLLIGSIHASGGRNPMLVTTLQGFPDPLKAFLGSSLENASRWLLSQFLPPLRSVDHGLTGKILQLTRKVQERQ